MDTMANVAFHDFGWRMMGGQALKSLWQEGHMRPTPPVANNDWRAPGTLGPGDPGNPTGEWDLMKPKSLEDMNSYNKYVIDHFVLRPVAAHIQRIVDGGAGPALYKGLTSDDPDKVFETIKSMINLYMHNYYRGDQQYQHFKGKLDQLITISKEQEGVRQIRIVLQGYFLFSHAFNDKSDESLMKILSVLQAIVKLG